MNFKSGPGDALLELFTGAYRCRIPWTPPTTVTILPTAGVCTATVANYLDVWNTWKLEATGNLGTLYLNDSPVITNCDMFAFAFFPGQMDVIGDGVVEIYHEYLDITED